MNTKKHIVHLSDEERQDPEKIVKKLKGTPQKVNRVLALTSAGKYQDRIDRMRRIECTKNPQVFISWLSI